MPATSGALLRNAINLKNVLDEIHDIGPAEKRSRLARSFAREIDLSVEPETRTGSYVQAYEALLESLEAYLQITAVSRQASKARKKKFSQISSLLSQIVLLNTEVPNAPRSGPYQSALFSSMATLLSASVVKPEFNNLYVLGCFERKKTLLTQQQRAILLAAGILKFWPKSKAPRVAIIGGGVAGVTAYCTLVRGGADVVLFERDAELMHLQLHNSARFLHPHLYDWPAPGSTQPRSGLPLMNWTAGYADGVAKQLRDELDRTVLEFGAAPPRTGFEVDTIELDHASRHYVVASDKHDLVAGFDVVIVAIGFGIEIENQFKVPTRGYWDDGAIKRSGKFSPDKPGRILVDFC